MRIRIRRIFRSKTAFSAVIASLILMLIAVASGVVVYAYVMGWIGNASQSSANTGVMSIDSVTANVTSSQLKLYVRNIGGSDLVLDKVYIAGTAVNNNSTTFTSASDSAKLPIQKTAYLEYNGTSVQPGKFYEVKVVCIDGTTVSTSVEAK
jgi:hypothetical protein